MIEFFIVCWEASVASEKKILGVYGLEDIDRILHGLWSSKDPLGGIGLASPRGWIKRIGLRPGKTLMESFRVCEVVRGFFET